MTDNVKYLVKLPKEKNALCTSFVFFYCFLYIDDQRHIFSEGGSIRKIYYFIKHAHPKIDLEYNIKYQINVSFHTTIVEYR